jgi:hypothetical protein
MKSRWAELVSTRRSIVLSLPLQLGEPSPFSKASLAATRYAKCRIFLIVMLSTFMPIVVKLSVVSSRVNTLQQIIRLGVSPYSLLWDEMAEELFL